MSSYTQPNMKTFCAEGSLATKQYCFVKFGSSNKQVVACGNGEKAIGVLMTADVNDKDSCEVALIGGGALLKVAGAVALGDSLKSDANGKGVVGAGWTPAIAQDSGVANDVISVILDAHISA